MRLCQMRKIPVSHLLETLTAVRKPAYFVYDECVMMTHGMVQLMMQLMAMYQNKRMKKRALKKKERALTQSTRDTCNPQWKKFQMWMNGPTFIMAMRTPHEQDSEQGEDEMAATTSRSRSRGSCAENPEPEPKTMPKPLARRAQGTIAMNLAMDMIEAIENSGPSSSSGSQAMQGRINEENYFLSSVPMANFFSIMPVPREPVALDDYRWDMLGQGVGPENFVVINCRNLSNHIPMEMNLVERANQQRLLRHLQGLLVKFQSGVPEMWMEAAERVRAWIGSDRDVDFFDEVETHFGSPRHEEGEEEENTDDDDPKRISTTRSRRSSVWLRWWWWWSWSISWRWIFKRCRCWMRGIGNWIR